MTKPTWENSSANALAHTVHAHNSHVGVMDVCGSGGGRCDGCSTGVTVQRDRVTG